MAEAKEKTITAAVARGHTIMVGRGRDEREIGPGKLVKLPAEEAERFIALGFLLSPDDDGAVPIGMGPVYEVSPDLTRVTAG